MRLEKDKEEDVGSDSGDESECDRKFAAKAEQREQSLRELAVGAMRAILEAVEAPTDAELKAATKKKRKKPTQQQARKPRRAFYALAQSDDETEDDLPPVRRQANRSVGGSGATSATSTKPELLAVEGAAARPAPVHAVEGALVATSSGDAAVVEEPSGAISGDEGRARGAPSKDPCAEADRNWKAIEKATRDSIFFWLQVEGSAAPPSEVDWQSV